MISHRLDLESVYKHILQGSGSSEVTTLNADGGATVDYIFYSPRRPLTCDPKGMGICHKARNHLIFSIVCILCGILYFLFLSWG